MYTNNFWHYEEIFFSEYMGETWDRKNVMIYESESMQINEKEPLRRTGAVCVIGILVATGCLDAHL